LAKYHKQSPQANAPFTLEKELPRIDKIFSGNTIEEIVHNLKADDSEWSRNILENFSKVSPSSLKISLKLLEKGSQLDLQDCLKMEYRLAVRCCDNNDFAEGECFHLFKIKEIRLYILPKKYYPIGVRALLIDKDQKPKWKPKTLEQVTEKIVDKYFDPLPTEAELVV
jgi:3-hydroxyisobutyryl-CoA hydrolase